MVGKYTENCRITWSCSTTVSVQPHRILMFTWKKESSIYRVKMHHTVAKHNVWASLHRLGKTALKKYYFLQGILNICLVQPLWLCLAHCVIYILFLAHRNVRDIIMVANLRYHTMQTKIYIQCRSVDLISPGLSPYSKKCNCHVRTWNTKCLP